MSGIQHGIAWNESYALGNEQVDAQHKNLFELVSKLIGACIAGHETEKLQEILDFLVNYTVQHFTDEEALQLVFNYPEYVKHKKLHEDFKVTVGELVKNFLDNGSSIELSNNVNKIVVRWLVNHITYEDKKIGIYIREKKV